ncbi:MAG TPA: hypothetical protein VFM17_05635 [Candidatus Eisenbacteria bacterium]|jgi:hypothetical protein|nr:hypothetical protein [Candidatus Eisenbacteria bacterium]HEU4333204.1 hypothetical protein [Candidatus Eisenbacteria bacterium]
MKRLLALAFAALLLVPAADLRAQSGGATAAPKGPKKPSKFSGELLDMGCYISQGLKGQLHKECATKCINNGVPMGLITADSTVYVLSQNHDRAMEPKSFGNTPDPYQQLKGWAAEQVEIFALPWERNGIKFLEVKFAKLASKAPATPAKPGS